MFAALAVGQLAACSPAPSVEYADWLFDLPDATPVKEYPQVPPEDGPTSAVRMVEDLVIGGEPDVPDTLLYRPVDVVASEDGTVYVADRGAHHIKVFGADGTWQRNLGTEGQGPGEFNGLDQLTIAGGRLVAYDTRNDRFSVWTLDGAHVADHKPTETRTPRSLFGLTDGSLVWDYLTYNDGGTTQEHAERIGVEGERLDALLDRPGPPVRAISMDDPVGMVQAFLDALEDPRLVLVAGEDVVYFSPGAQYQLLAMTPNGDPLWALRLAGPPPGIPAERRGPFVAALDQQSRVPLNLSADDLTWPQRIPAIFALRVDGRGRLFVFLPPEGPSLLWAELPPESWRVHVYSPTSDHLASDTVPARWDFARGEHVYVMRTGANEDPVVVRYRLTIEGS